MAVMADHDLGLGLAGRTVLVTGAASGIGRAVAGRFAALGAQVALADIDVAGVEASAAELPGDALTVRCDLADAQSCADAVDATVAHFGRLEILVNAGAIIVRRSLDGVTAADLDRMVHVNMAGPLFLSRAAAGAMKGLKFGRIILFSSQSAHTGGYVGSTVYSMTKAAVVSLTKSLAREFAADGITVNSIAPGLVDTPMARRDVPPEALERFMRMIPLARIAAPEEMANCCLFLASDWASYVTGHTLDANGGQLMR